MTGKIKLRKGTQFALRWLGQGPFDRMARDYNENARVGGGSLSTV